MDLFSNIASGFADRHPARRRPSTSSMRYKGFTLIEAMVSIAVLAIFMGAAVPGLTQFMVSSRLTSQINELVGDISRARNEAGARGINVSVCVADSASTCAASGTGWETGRIIFADRDGDGVIASSADIIKYVPALEGGANLAAASFSSDQYITFRPFGGLTSAAGGTFTLCAPGYTTGRKISIAGTGRPTASKTTCPSA